MKKLHVRIFSYHEDEEGKEVLNMWDFPTHRLAKLCLFSGLAIVLLAMVGAG